MDEVTIQRALDDIRAIQRAIERTRPDGTTTSSSLLAAGALQQILCVLLALIIVVTEATTDHFSTRAALVSLHNRQFQVESLLNVALVLLLGVLTLYTIPLHSARKGGVPYAEMVARHFSHLKNFSLVWDLLVKFVVISILVLGDAPQFIAPLLCVFTADWLFQGRFFTLSFSSGCALGVAAVVAAALQCALDSPLLIVPASVFAAAGLTSLISLYRRRTSSASQGEEDAA